MNNREVLEKTLDILRDKGWTQGQSGNDRIGYCLVGAVVRASGADLAKAQAVVSVLRESVDDFDRTVPWRMTQFNDAEGREFADIEKVLLSAIEKAL